MTFDLPDDVMSMLRLESARRGGRATAPMNQLIAEAVRKVSARKKRISATEGHEPSGARDWCWRQ